ncbi:MAG: radical SAM family heme chaperone HemW [Flavobacteriaceae bacterium]|nr:MAG: radical SAM family heme chaperone HemW [Flavobacteriaceae bacterium]
MAGIYIHIPFCKQACHYCDFHFSTSLKKKDELISALLSEMELRKSELINEPIETIYFGGGTPSLLAVETLETLINKVKNTFQVSIDPEITLEANPDDLLPSYIEKLSESSINRLSIGIQSFFDEDLRFMNRAHNAQEAHETLEIAAKNFNNISIDLIYGIPNSGMERWKENIKIALSYSVPHISSYALTVEPKTALASFIKKGLVSEIDEKEVEAQFLELIDVLEANDFLHYEISNFGKKGYFSKNNSAYWKGKNYIGIGPSAHSFIGKQRSWNIKNNSKYIQSIKTGELPSENEYLSLIDRYNEYIMTGLRTMWGVSLDHVETTFGKPFLEDLLSSAEHFIEEHLLYIDNDNLLVTKRGKFLCDGIASHLFKLN